MHPLLEELGRLRQHGKELMREKPLPVEWITVAETQIAIMTRYQKEVVGCTCSTFDRWQCDKAIKQGSLHATCLCSCHHDLL